MTDTLKRRHYDQLIEQAGGNAESAMFDVLADLNEKIDRLQSTIDSHITDEEARFVKVEAGFPDGDPGEHRRYHEALIQRIKARGEFWSKLSFELAKWGFIGFLGWALLQLWPAFLKGPK